jgi:hypothetical protein
MKKYQMQVRLSYYVWVDVEAVDEHSARDQGIRKAHSEMDKGHGCWGEEPEVVNFNEGESNE